MTVRTFNPKQFTITFGGQWLTDLAPGVFIEARWDQPRFRIVRGIDGDSARVRNVSRSGTINVTLQQSSLSNNWLSSFNIADELLGASVFPFLARDAGGGTTIFAASAFVREIPPIGMSTTATDRTWTFVTDNLFLYLGGLPIQDRTILPGTFVQNDNVPSGMPTVITKVDNTEEGEASGHFNDNHA